MLDKSKPYGETFGMADHKYIQDGIKYLVDGEPLTPDPVVELPEAPKKANKPRRPRKTKVDAQEVPTFESKDWG